MPRRNRKKKQRQRAAAVTRTKPRPVNSINWDPVAWRLYRAGLISFEATGQALIQHAPESRVSLSEARSRLGVSVEADS